MTTPQAWGIQPGYHDVSGTWREAPAETVGAIMDVMGAGEDAPPEPAMWILRADRPLPALPAGRLLLEGGGELTLDAGAPVELPLGYHHLVTDDAPPRQLVVSPGVVPLPNRPMWGFAAQLYAVRSQLSWGIGDLADLRRLGRWSASLGAGMTLINPLHAVSPTKPQQPSPYFAGSRCFFNPLYLAVEEVPGAVETAEVAGFARSGAAFNRERHIDRDRVWRLKSMALEAVFKRFQGHPSFDAFEARGGEALRKFATFCTLAENLGPEWSKWPSALRSPDTEQARNFASSRVGEGRIRYHIWLQWLLDQQLSNAGTALGVVQDLAVGVDPEGADAWIWQDTFARGTTIGAPPDEFATRGQNWALAPFDPWRLRSSGYAPWVTALRSILRHGYGLRVDHVMGLFRLYWIPDGRTPAEGAYVRYPHDDLLNILALEAHRAGAFVAGEDLGTVEDEVRLNLAERNVLSYRIWWFESERTTGWPEKALGAVSTHDLPTIAGVLSGSDLEAQRRIGLQPNEEASAGLQRKLLDWTASDAHTPTAEVVDRVYADLARAPSLVLAASLDDVLEVEERPNMPGTVDEWPNWSLALPASLEEIAEAPLPLRIAAALSRDAGRP